MYVADTGNHIIRKLTKNDDGTTYSESLLAGSPGSSDDTDDLDPDEPRDAKFNSPSDITLIENNVDGDYLFVTDSKNHTIRMIRIKNGGIYVSTIAGIAGVTGTTDGNLSTAKFNFPFGITCNKSTGDLFVIDRSNHNIRQLKKASNYEVSTIAGGIATFYYPYGITLHNSGNLYVTDLAQFKIHQIAGDHNVTTIENTGDTPAGITTDNKGNLYYCSSTKIFKVNLQ